jgi:hypothetical protein
MSLIDAKRKSELERIVKKYALNYSKEVENLDELPLSELPVIIHKILNESTRMEDRQKLYPIVQLTGAAIDIPTISE